MGVVPAVDKHLIFVRASLTCAAAPLTREKPRLYLFNYKKTNRL